MPLLRIAGAQLLNMVYEQEPYNAQSRYLTARMAAFLPFPVGPPPQNSGGVAPRPPKQAGTTSFSLPS